MSEDSQHNRNNNAGTEKPNAITGRIASHQTIRRANMKASPRLYVGNLHHSTSEGDLIKLFMKHGTVKDVTYLWHKVGPNRGQPKGFAFIEMSSPDEATTAMRIMDGVFVKGRRLHVSYSDSEGPTTKESALQRGVARDSYGGSRGKDNHGSRFAEKRRAEEISSGSIIGGVAVDDLEGADTDAKKQRRELHIVDEKMRKLQATLAALERKRP